MAIRFSCNQCDRPLGIASRKVGSEINCPHCGAVQVVPNEEAAAASEALKSLGPASPVADGSPTIGTRDSSTRIVASSPGGSFGSRAPAGMILYPRNSVYVRGVLFAVVAIGAFLSGYFIGQGDATVEKQVEVEAKPPETLLIQGIISYREDEATTSDDRGDHRAVVLALPEGKAPKERIPARGFRPQDAPLAEDSREMRRLAELGGACARVGESGVFNLRVPEPGPYRFLLISGNTERPSEGSGSEADEIELNSIGQVFSTPALLLGRQKYFWSPKARDVTAEFGALNHDFGISGEQE
ncbi:MAG: hypothetical protein HQ581_09205 [Planctomycetes bacterium]|nr:hypothetical protein [Planctomycetota bacterium]